MNTPPNAERRRLLSVRLIFVSLFLATAAIGLQGCDSNQAAREAAQRELSQHESTLNELRSQQSRLSTEIAAQEREIASQKKAADELQQTRAKQRAELMSYLSDHKAAAAALAAAGGGAAAVMDDDVKSSLQSNGGDSAQGFAIIAGVIGAGYCIFNADECAGVTAKIAAYGVANKDTDSALERGSKNVIGLQQRIEQLKTDGKMLPSRIQQADMAADSARGKVQRLRCSGLLC